MRPRHSDAGHPGLSARSLALLEARNAGRRKRVARRRHCEDQLEAAVRLGVPEVVGHGLWWIWWE